MPTTFVSTYFESITLQVDTQVPFNKDVSTNGFTKADAAYFGNPSAYLATSIVTIGSGVNTLSGTNETTFLAWLAANPTQNIVFGVVSTPTTGNASFQVAT
jgi:hypothetical protein